jgi:hypothetical protein
MEETMNKVNPWAVIVAAVVHWVLAAGWFTVLGPTWLAGSGISAERAAELKAHPEPGPYVIAILSNLVMALVLAKVISWVGQWSVAGGARVGLVLGFGIAFCAMITADVFEYKPLSFILISAGYPVVGMTIMGAILGAWKPKGV